MRHLTLNRMFIAATMLGSVSAAFAEEVDYTLGYLFEGEGWEADVSVNHLTYPGNNDDASTELVAAVGFNGAIAPQLTGFYDLDSENYGLECQWNTSKTTRTGTCTY